MQIQNSRLLRVTIIYLDYQSSHSQILELANNSLTEKSQNKSHKNISELAVCSGIKSCYTADSQLYF